MTSFSTEAFDEALLEGVVVGALSVEQAPELGDPVQRGVLLESITAQDIPTRLLEGGPARPGDVELPNDGLNLEGYLDDIRAGLMRQALDRTSGVQTQAAELLGMSFRSFRYYAKKMSVTTAGRPVEPEEG